MSTHPTYDPNVLIPQSTTSSACSSSFRDSAEPEADLSLPQLLHIGGNDGQNCFVDPCGISFPNGVAYPSIPCVSSWIVYARRFEHLISHLSGNLQN
jgi:hypothetical protein